MAYILTGGVAAERGPAAPSRGPWLWGGNRFAHDDAICEPTGQRIKECAIIDRGGGQGERTEASGFVALDVALDPLPPMPFLDLRGPC